jgi:hypothetical protein
LRRTPRWRKPRLFAKSKPAGGLNIEALEFSPEQTLLIGFRSPLLDNNAIIACLENPAAMFNSDEAPRISPSLVTLNLEGNGIRGMSYLYRDWAAI